MKKLIFLFISTLFLFDDLRGQFPNFFLSDIYDIEWCEKSNINSLSVYNGSKLLDKYKFNNGLKIAERSKNVKIEEKGTLIKEVQGRGKMIVLTELSKDKKRLVKKKQGNIQDFYYYDSEDRLHFIVSDVEVQKTVKIPEGMKKDMHFYRLSEFERDLKGRIIKKEIYRYDHSLLEYGNDIGRMMSLEDRTLLESWEYHYNSNNLVDEIEVLKWRRDEGAWEKRIVNIENKDGLPSYLSVNLESGAIDKFFGNKSFKYSLN